MDLINTNAGCVVNILMNKTGSPYNFTHYPVDVIKMAVFLYYRYKLSFADVSELMAIRGIMVSHETIRQWVLRCGADIGIKFSKGRWGVGRKKWHMDITYLKVQGYDVYLYRAIDIEGNLIDVYLSEKRDKEAAYKFFLQCSKATNIIPSQITTDKEPGFKDAIAKALGPDVIHRDNKYLNNRIEQHHRGVKSWHRPMKGFKSMWSAMISCHTFGEFKQFFKAVMPLSKKRGFIASKCQEMLIMV